VPPLVAIVGETASGKSALAMELAQMFNGEIICADSWTVYKGFDIGTAKPTAAERALIPHHLLDVADPVEGFSAAVFQRLAHQAIAQITDRGRLPILVGGTGLYVDSVLFGYSFLQQHDPAVRADLNLKSLDELLAMAATQNLDMSNIDVRNKRRVIRHIENHGVLPTRQNLRQNTLVLGMEVPRDELKARVAKRVDHMFDLGLEVEVLKLSQQYGWEVEPMKGIGYREWRDYFMFGDGAVHAAAKKPTLSAPASASTAAENLVVDGQGLLALSCEAVRDRILKSTMDLAKRQRTWFKRNSSIHPISDRSYAVELVTTFLNKSAY